MDKHNISMLSSANIKPSNISFIALDFDGVLTDNRVIVSPKGKESVVCNYSDGLAISFLRAEGYPVAVITSNSNGAVRNRCKKLGIDLYVATRRRSKGDIIAEIAACTRLSLDNFMYIGNDINDIDVLEEVGYPVVPPDATPLLFEHFPTSKTLYVTNAKGGEGIIQEIASKLIRSNLNILQQWNSCDSIG